MRRPLPFAISDPAARRMGTPTSSSAKAPLSAQAEPEGFYRQPAIQGKRLVFVAEGDLWTVGLNGGNKPEAFACPS